jgi:hypothetical protein
MFFFRQNPPSVGSADRRQLLLQQVKKKKSSGHGSFHFTGSNPTSMSYNANVVRIYKTTRSQMRFESKKKLLFFKKRSL